VTRARRRRPSKWHAAMTDTIRTCMPEFNYPMASTPKTLDEPEDSSCCVPSNAEFSSSTPSVCADAGVDMAKSLGDLMETSGQQEFLDAEQNTLPASSMRRSLKFFFIFTIVLACFRCKLFTIPVELFSYVTMDDFIEMLPTKGNNGVYPTTSTDTLNIDKGYFDLTSPTSVTLPVPNLPLLSFGAELRAQSDAFVQHLNISGRTITGDTGAPATQATADGFYSQLKLSFSFIYASCAAEQAAFQALATQYCGVLTNGTCSGTVPAAAEATYMAARNAYESCFLVPLAMSLGYTPDAFNAAVWKALPFWPSTAAFCSPAWTLDQCAKYQASEAFQIVSSGSATGWNPGGIDLVPGYDKYYNQTQYLNLVNMFRLGQSQLGVGSFHPLKIFNAQSPTAFNDDLTRPQYAQDPTGLTNFYGPRVALFVLGVWDTGADSVKQTIHPPAQTSGLPDTALEAYWPSPVHAPAFWTWTRDWIDGVVLTQGLDTAALGGQYRQAFFRLRFIDFETLVPLTSVTQGGTQNIPVYGFTAKATEEFKFLTGGFYTKQEQLDVYSGKLTGNAAYGPVQFGNDVPYCRYLNPQNMIFGGWPSIPYSAVGTSAVNALPSSSSNIIWAGWEQSYVGVAWNCVSARDFNVLVTAMQYSQTYGILDDLVNFWECSKNGEYTSERTGSYLGENYDRFGFLNMGCDGNRKWSDPARQAAGYPSNITASIDWGCVGDFLQNCATEEWGSAVNANGQFSDGNRGQRCRDIIIFTNTIFNMPEIITETSQLYSAKTCNNKYQKAWKRLVSKAAFEKIDGEEKEIFVIQPSVHNCGYNATTGIASCSQIQVVKDAATPAQIDMFISRSQVDKYKAEDITVIWLAVSVFAGIMVALEMAWYGCQDPLFFYHIVHTGFPYALSLDADQDDPNTARPAVCRTYIDSAIWVLVLLVEFGVVMAEAAVPTTQVYAEWFWVDMVVVPYTTDHWYRQLEVLFPRISHLGLMGILFNVTCIVPTGRTALTAIISYSCITAMSMCLIVWTAFEGNDTDENQLYFLMPVYIQVFVQLCVVAWTVFHFWNAPTPWWESTLGVSSKTSRKIESMCLKVVPPRWVQIALILEREHPQKTMIQVRDTLVVRDHDDTERDSSSVLVLDPPPEDKLSASTTQISHESIHCTVNAATVERVKQEKGSLGCCEQLVFSVARLRELRYSGSNALFEATFLIGELLG